ncbi:MAG: hypothetical protein KKA19_06695 [Candidatus Margulisbacteria bacterium]|nr:hypothetical protein [Candidatus Margulisiibacteriota bacterium]
MAKKSKIERVLTRLKNIVAAVSKTNPVANQMYNIARNELLNNEKGLNITPGLGKILAEKYFPLTTNPAGSFYVQGIDPRTINYLKSS